MAFLNLFCQKKDRKKLGPVFEIKIAIVLSPNIFELAPLLQYIFSKVNSIELFFLFNIYFPNLNIFNKGTVKIPLFERRLSETTGSFEDDGRSRLFSLLSIAIKLPIIRISIIGKIQFFEVIRRSRLKKMLLNYPSRFEVQMSRMVIMISLFGRV